VREKETGTKEDRSLIRKRKDRFASYNFFRGRKGGKRGKRKKKMGRIANDWKKKVRKRCARKRRKGKRFAFS